MAIAAAPLIHIYLPKKNAEVVAYSKQLDKDIEKYNTQLTNLRTQYNNYEIEAEEYIASSDEILLAREKQLEINEALYDKKVDASRIFGFKTLRVFLVAFGIRIVYLFLSIAISIIVVLLVKPDKGLLKNSLVVFQIFCYSISLYEIVWVFWNAQDYPIQTYWWGILLSTTLISIAIVTFLMWHKFKMERQTLTIVKLFDFMHFDVKKLGFINSIKERQYDSKTQELVKEAIENE
ncbi:hypothetical protein [Flagellimonas sp. CMM7]|uniref:hypothetical protein n=1 Tax=Flagellimonas sp. CMM7 TaxID=2654676 RepID=UPI0013D089C4|nr:hypothetical protein [Flagellimonas sp. CMM7]UII80055.1 hypothetical protein LV704_00690 [Flagellimonas sp. CMM7]